MRRDDGYMSNWAQANYRFLQVNEMEALKKVIDDLSHESVCVNIGAGLGCSGAAFIESDTVGTLYTIELYATANDNPMGCLENETGLFARFGFDKDPRYHQILGDSTMVGKMWEHGLVDMIFLDADHSYSHTYMNIMMWLPHIKRNGVFSFHDYDEPLYPGVKQACDELLHGRELFLSAPTFAAFRV